MGKRMLTVILLAIIVFTGTAFATSWTLSSRVMTTGGSLQVRNDTPITSANGTVMKTYTTSKIVPVSLIAGTGYSISAVSVNGVAQTLPVPNPVSMGLPAFNPIKTSQTITVSYTKTLVSVTVYATDGGSVNPSGSFTLQQGSVQNFTFTPNTGKSLTSVSGLPAGGTLTDASTGVAVTLPYSKPVKATFTVPSTPVSLTGAFVGVIANAGPNQTAVVGSTVTLSGSATVYDGTSVSYAWTQSAGTPVTLYNATTTRPSFTTSAAGSYRFTLVTTTAAGATSSANTLVTVTSSPAAAAEAQCQSCHVSAGVGIAQNVFNKWSSSRHYPNAVMCYKCHLGADTGSHPGPALTSSTLLNICTTCHLDANSQVIGGHPFDRGSLLCTDCHDAHSTAGTMVNTPTASHFNNSTSAGYPASYVTSRITCANCHTDSTQNSLMRSQWAQSSHGNTTAAAFASNDFKTMDGCVRCHTTTGFLAFSTARVTNAWGDPADRTKELVACIACHADFTQGVLRTMPPIKPYPDDDHVNRDLSKSNLCMACHSGTNNGASIQVKVGSADFTNLPFIAPHYRVAGGTLQARAGYHFSGNAYDFYTSNTHRMVGMNNQANTGTSGPCIGCHMTTDQKHSFLPVITYGDNNIIALSSTACANCHGSTLTTTVLENRQAGYRDSLATFKAMLEMRGVPYTSSAPYFSQLNWGSGQSGADMMGAAYNYQLLVSEPGAFVHNPSYAKKLISDSIDYLYNGSVTGSIDTALTYLVDNSAITQTLADSAASYQRSTCTSCHGGPASATPSMATNGHATHLTGSYGPGAFLGGEATACQACHAGAGHLNGVVEVAKGASSTCAGCHPAGIPTWSDSTRLACTSCHALNASTLPNGVAAPYKGSFTSTGHGKYALSNSCAACHDANAPHITGMVGTYKRLTLPSGNDLCVSCHNDSTKVRTQYLKMVTHKSFACATCHDPHGTSNLSMIRTNIMGNDVSYTDATYGLVDRVNWRGLCQICHTVTNHYRAGEPETNHPTSGCLNCHSHKSAGSGFKPSGGSCDSCHGYPPAPKSPAVPFGTPSNWAAARYEDYSGGGGAHLTAVHVSPFADPSEGWANCTICHNGGRSDAEYHQMVVPVSTHIENVHVEVDPQYRFAQGFTIYTGSKRLSAPAVNNSGSCYNISCHMTPSRRWSTER